MGAEEMAHANWRLDNPPVVDVAVSRRMGLFVIARLAARHGIRVRLRPAPTGGLTALVWLPDEVITRGTLTSTVRLRRFQADASAGAVSWMDSGPSEPLAPPAAAIPDPVACDEAAGADHPVIVPTTTGTRPENRLPIFEAVESDWFRRGKPSVDWSASVPELAPASWSSRSDDGWRAAKVAQAPLSAGFTGAGLPKRVPNANLVPGGIAPLAVPPSDLPTRSAEQTRQRLTSFQQGIRQARVAGAEGKPPTTKEDT
jgi:hypothetical protein